MQIKIKIIKESKVTYLEEKINAFLKTNDQIVDINIMPDSDGGYIAKIVYYDVQQH